jgi:hypothetical protein
MGNIAVMRTLALVVRGIKVHYEIKWTRAACRLVSRGPPYTRRSVFTKSSGCWTKLAQLVQGIHMKMSTSMTWATIV